MPTSLGVLGIAGLLGGLAYVWLSSRHVVHAPDAGPTDDGPPIPLPDALGPRCGPRAVDMVRRHLSADGRTVGEQAEERVRALPTENGGSVGLGGWHAREDHQRRDMCRVSLRYSIGEARGAVAWLVDPESGEADGVEPLDGIAVESTGRAASADAAEERRLADRCSNDAVGAVRRHFSFMDRYDVWGCLQILGAQQQLAGGPAVEWGGWAGRVEARDRCIVALGYREGDRTGSEYWRVRYQQNGEHDVEPLSPRAIEAIYGPGVHSR